MRVGFSAELSRSARPTACGSFRDSFALVTLATAILAVAEEEGSELLVIGTKRDRVRGLAKHVLRKAACRVLVVSS